MKSILFNVLLITFFSSISSARQVYLDAAVDHWTMQASEPEMGSKNRQEEMKLLILLNTAPSKQFSVRQAQIMTAKQVQQLRSEFQFLKERTIELLWAANGFFVTLNRDETLQLLKNRQIKAISDAQRKIKLETLSAGNDLQASLKVDFTYGLKNIKVPDLKKSRPDLTGAGIKVGVLDTGIYPLHPDLNGRLTRFKNFSPSTDETAKDPFGHGTHVAGTIAGGSSSGLSIGVAPQVDLVVGRIFDGNGDSTKELILKAMQWMLDPDENPLTTDDIPRIVNSSWGDDDPYSDRDPDQDAFCLVIDTWTKAGIVPVFSAGNTGPRPKSINVPGACPSSLTVGATEQWDRSPHFSSEGPAQWKTVEIMKPDVVAPGVDIKSAGNYGNKYEVMSGTSMAAPHVSGALALLFQAKPQLTHDEAVQLLKAGVKDLGNPGQDTTFGFGRIDILRTVELLTPTQPK
jgi:subtilisin family serine protease